MSQVQTSAPTGNSFLDAITGAVNIGFGVLDEYSGYLSNKAAIEIAKNQSVTVPDQVVTVPTNNGNNFLSNPENIQKVLLYGSGAGIVAIIAYFIVKKF